MEVRGKKILGSVNFHFRVPSDLWRTACRPDNQTKGIFWDHRQMVVCNILFFKLF